MFRSHAYLDNSQLECADGSRLELQSLPGFLRVLLVTDGTVTKSLEAYFWEPVVVLPQRQFELSLTQSRDELAAAAGETLLQREVILQGRHSGRQFAFARSWLRLDKLPPELAASLKRGEIGIGELLREQGIETYREIISVDQFDPRSSADGFLSTIPGAAVTRSYRIRAAGEPAFLVSEFFPLSLY